MKRGTQVGVAALLAALVAGVALWLSVRSVGPRARGPMQHPAYVWQRAWTPDVRRAIRGHAGELAALVALGAEISWSADRFYKALVRRCGATDLGRRADQLRWFPPLAKKWHGRLAREPRSHSRMREVRLLLPKTGGIR